MCVVNLDLDALSDAGERQGLQHQGMPQPRPAQRMLTGVGVQAAVCWGGRLMQEGNVTITKWSSCKAHEPCLDKYVGGTW